MNEEYEWSQDELWKLRALTSKVGWKAFMFELGCLMAEQTDKSSGDQSDALFRMSNLFHCDDFLETAKECGKFDYLTCGMLEEEHKHYFKE